MQAPRLHGLIGRTTIGIGQRIVNEALFGINPLAAALTPIGLAQEFEVGTDPKLLAGDQVMDAALAGIGNDRLSPLTGHIFMSLH